MHELAHVLALRGGTMLTSLVLLGRCSLRPLVLSPLAIGFGDHPPRHEQGGEHE